MNQPRSVTHAMPGLEAIRRKDPLLGEALSALDGQVRRANATAGRARLVDGQALVSTGSATEAAEYFFQVREAGGTPGILTVSEIVEGRGFLILSSSSSDTSLVSWCVRYP